MTTRSFVWLSLGGGAWSLGSNWNDITDGADPSLVAPGAADSVTVAGPSGAQMQTITGQGAVAAALFTGNTILSGGFSAAQLTVGGAASGGILQLSRATSLLTQSALVASGSLVAGPGGTLSVAGTLTLGQAGAGTAALNATGGGAASVLALVMASSADSIYVDPASIVEVGTASAGRAGNLTIDAGATLSGQGDADAYGSVVNNGMLAASGGTLMVGTLSGTGSLQIGAGATLALNGACGVGQSVTFAGANATLAINEEFFAPAGAVAGFVAGDAIDVVGSLISAASYAGGVLTLSYGGQVAAQLQLSGNYAGDVFLTDGDGDGGTLVTVAPGSGSGSGGGGQTPSPGTSTPDQYDWTASGSGAWNIAANWQDVTTGATPAAVAPGAANLVSIAGGQDVFSVVSGPADAAALSLLADVALSGAYMLGTLTVGQSAGTSFAPGTLDMLAGTVVDARSVWVADGAISAAGAGAFLSVAGTLTLGGGITGVGLPTAGLTATAGGSVQAACLVLGGGSGASIATDPTGWVEVGTAGGAAAGAVTVDAGATLSGNGQVNPYGLIDDNGAIEASGGTLTLGAVSGAGSLTVAAGATLELIAATSAPIVLDGSAIAGGATIAFAGPLAAPTGTLTGFVVGDAIHLEGTQLTQVQYAASGNGGTLLLINGTTILDRIAIAGPMTGEHFVLSPDGADGAFITLSASTGGGGGTGQTGTDELAWINPVSGNWSHGGNWTDVTTGTIAKLPPGSQTPVQITGPGGLDFQSITGTGTSASLALAGNTALSGTFTTGQIAIGQAATATAAAVAGTLEVGFGTTLTATQTVIADGALLCVGSLAAVTVSATVTLGTGASGAGEPGALLSVSNRAVVQFGGLTLNGNSDVAVDGSSSVEVGSAGGAASGALTVDAGALASGNGTLNAAGAVTDNGLVEAQGGTLVLGAVTGTGTLGIGAEAVLALPATDPCPIAFLGGGGTLLLPASALLPAGVISGFAAGDSLVAGSPVDAVTFQPGAGGIGTLSLSVAGQTIGQLLLAGNFANESFSVQPDGTGAAIILSAPTANGPPAGTATPDAYVWTGAAGGSAWSNAGNWTDTSQGPGATTVAPGQNDAVGIAGGAGRVLPITGPADASALSLSGSVSLAGAYAVGTLSVGSAQAAGLLALGGNAAVSAGNAEVAGGIAVGGGTLSVAGTLALGSGVAAGAGGVLAVSNQGIVRSGVVVLGGLDSALATDSTGSVEIGGAAGAAAGGVTIDADGVLEGQGAVELAGQILDDGLISAQGGTLLVGSVSGAGTLLVGPGAALVLDGSVGSRLTADFAAAGTLTFAGTLAGTPSIADFGTGDAIVLPVSGGAEANYAATGAGVGVLSVANAGGQVLAQLTLLGSQAGRVFSAAVKPGGGTILTTEPDNTSGQGGDGIMSYPNLTTGQIARGDLLNDIALGFSYVSQDDVGNLIGNQGIFLDYSTEGLAPAQTVFGGMGEPAGVNVEVVAPLVQTGVGGVGPDSAIALQPGYSAMLLEGNESLGLTDGVLGHALLAGNYGNDTIAALGDGDTLVGATGANTVFFAALQNANNGSSLPVDVYVHGGGNDTIATNQDNAAITTSGGYSTVFLGGSDNNVVSNGSDTIIAGGQGGDDTISAQVGAGRAGDVVFGVGQDILTFVGGNAPSTVVGSGSEIQMYGGSGNGSELWAGSSDVDYYGGAGSALIIGGSGQTYVQGGSGPVTVFGGTGQGIFSGAPGSIFVVGAGASTVTAAAGDAVFLVGSAAVSVTGGSGADVYGGGSIGNNIFTAGAGPETLWGGAGNDQFNAGAGPDILVAGGGDDTFNFTNGVAGGIDTVVGFVPGESTIALHGYGSQMPQITTAWGDSFINLGNGSSAIVLGVTDLTSHNFTFS